jgi:hypothetical protein
MRAALFQLSYRPENILICNSYIFCLIASRFINTQPDSSSASILNWDQVNGIKLRAIHRKKISLPVIAAVCSSASQAA